MIENCWAIGGLWQTDGHRTLHNVACCERAAYLTFGAAARPASAEAVSVWHNAYGTADSFCIDSIVVSPVSDHSEPARIIRASALWWSYGRPSKQSARWLWPIAMFSSPELSRHILPVLPWRLHVARAATATVVRLCPWHTYQTLWSASKTDTRKQIPGFWRVWHAAI